MDPESPESPARRCVSFFCPHDCVAVPAVPPWTSLLLLLPLGTREELRGPGSHVEQASHTLLHIRMGKWATPCPWSRVPKTPPIWPGCLPPVEGLRGALVQQGALFLTSCVLSGILPLHLEAPCQLLNSNSPSSLLRARGVSKERKGKPEALVWLDPPEGEAPLGTMGPRGTR